MLAIIEKDCIVLTYLVIPQGCTYTCMHATMCTCMQKSRHTLTGYHLVFSLYDDIYFGVAQNTCAWLTSDLPFIAHRVKCRVLARAFS